MSGLSSISSERARIEVSGVRSSWVTEDMKSSFRWSRLCSCSLAARSSAGRLLERARLLLERAGVAAELRGLVEDLEHVVDRERLLLGDRFDHDARRGGADGAGDLALDPVDEAGVGDEVGDRDADLAGVLVEERAGAGGAEEAAGERAQVVEAGAAAPEHRLGAAAAEDVDEEQRLARLAGRGAAGEREADVEREVDRQAPEQRVGEVVEAGKAEQPFGREQRDARAGRASRKSAAIQPDFATEGSISV